MTSEKSGRGLIFYFYSGLFIAVSVFFIGAVVLLFYASTQTNQIHLPASTADTPIYMQIASWFDPVFFQYNLALLVFAVGIIPLVTLCYISAMSEEKKRRLQRDLPPAIYLANSGYIQSYLGKIFNIRNYLGSMMTLMFVVIFGCMIILLLKPAPLALPDLTHGNGVDYYKGANFLMLGTYMKSYMDGTGEYLDVLIYTLTAFQFGFLGGYVYFIGLMVRSYFTLDMTPNIFISSSVRMITGSLLALVLSYFFIDPGGLDLGQASGVNEHGKISGVDEILIRSLPVWSFFIGYFPNRGLAFLENIATKALGLARVHEFASPLSDLPGINYNHEILLNREGFDNIENLANANALDLAMRTGFSYSQLVQWISQARLHGYLRNDYHAFVEHTGIVSLDDFIHFCRTIKLRDSSADPVEMITASLKNGKNDFSEKIRILNYLVEANDTVTDTLHPAGNQDNTAASEAIRE
ncbi:helix-hairpin-helix domain-containing protein [uncultured Nitrosomonas sp.]|uniref:helix-hairpin-helix domain-containing protein n=1 Tax=uncultured Nitrosomonas sp. TaxID=156424 RepID=UPI002619AEB9|nr:helix-hairpin-helix domain-containing protein [uncultured Nitrosomonas sp.]